MEVTGQLHYIWLSDEPLVSTGQEIRRAPKPVQRFWEGKHLCSCPEMNHNYSQPVHVLVTVPEMNHNYSQLVHALVTVAEMNHNYSQPAHVPEMNHNYSQSAHVLVTVPEMNHN